MPIQKDHLWGPLPDSEMRTLAERMIGKMKLHPVFQQNGACNLSEFDPKNKLYILAHGHGELPYFMNDNGQWSASQVAKMLKADNLPTDQREIELLVCNAGESVNDKKRAAKLEDLFGKLTDAKAAGKNIDAIKAQYNRSILKSTAPQPFEKDPEKLLLPMAAQLAQALKLEGFTHFSIISYMCPVSTVMTDEHVRLDLSGKEIAPGVKGVWGAKASLFPKFRVVWR